MDKKPTQSASSHSPKDEPPKRLLLPAGTLTRKDVARRLKKAEGATVRHARRFIFTRLERALEVRRHIAIWVILVAYVIAATALQLTWYQQGYRTTAGDRGGTYAEAVRGPLKSLNPLVAQSSAEQSAARLLFSSLLTYDTTGHIQYDLATSVTLDETQKIYTITLRDDAQWQDGQPITAQDVAFTVDLIKNPQVHATTESFQSITVKAIDKKTVQFELPSAYAAFKHYLTFPVVPSHILKNVAPSTLNEDQFSVNPVGSGPFTFRLLQNIDAANDRKVLHLVRNTDYYGGAVKLERFQLDVYESDDAIVNALKGSEVNAATDLTVSASESFDTTRFAVQRKTIDAGVYALFNMTSPVLQDSNIRRALQTGTNTKEVRATLGEQTPELYLPFFKGQVTGELPAAPVYDNAVAAKYLDESGWKLGDDGVRKKDNSPLRLRVVVMKHPDFERVTSELVEQWKQLGILASITVADPESVSDRVAQNILQPRNYDVLVYQLTTSADPDVYAYWHSSQASQTGANYSNYNNAISDNVLASARGRNEPELRNAKYLTFARQWLSDAPAIGLYQSTVQYVANKSIRTVTGGQQLVGTTDRYAGISSWTVSERNVFTTP